MSGSFDVFLCHNSKDKPTVRQLAEALKARGLQVWLDEEQFVPGRLWQQALEEIIQTARTAAVLIGRDGLGPWENPEMRACLSEFVNRHLPVIPVLLPDAPAKPKLPLFLRAFTWVDLRSGLTKEGLDRLVWGIKGVKPEQTLESAENRLHPVLVPAILGLAMLLGGTGLYYLENELFTPTTTTTLNIQGMSAQQVQDLQKQTAQAVKMSVEFTDALKAGGQGPVMVVIPGGQFLMGSPATEPERNNDERQHEVKVAAFAISKYEVSFDDYDRFAEATGREKPSDADWGRGRQPVIKVSWNDAVAYAQWLSQQTGKSYRLPTEAQWEYAARAGTTTPFYFGATISMDQANYNGNHTYNNGRKGVYRGKTIEVGQFPANAWGLHDMHGNVWEWTASEYDESYGGAERDISNPNSSARRVLRGGGWDYIPEYVQSANRDRVAPGGANNFAGFRLARDL